jgi:chromosomal replication initiation ATPase DnaA
VRVRRTSPLDVTRAALSIERVQREVAAHFGVSVDNLKAKVGRRDRGRGNPHGVPCRVAMYLVREDMALTFSAIGQAFGGRHYVHVMREVNRFVRQLETDGSLSPVVQAIRTRVRNIGEALDG